jgi:hypothetical protein
VDAVDWRKEVKMSRYFWDSEVARKVVACTRPVRVLRLVASEVLDNCEKMEVQSRSVLKRDERNAEELVFEAMIFEEKMSE